jgi:hypothetical protein
MIIIIISTAAYWSTAKPASATVAERFRHLCNQQLQPGCSWHIHINLGHFAATQPLGPATHRQR